MKNESVRISNDTRWLRDEHFRYVITELDENIIPKISGENFSALCDYPAIYI